MAETVNTSDSLKRYHNDRRDWFACILYPEEDPDHKLFLEYVLTHPAKFISCVYIYHDKDFMLDDDGLPVPKKPHMHLLFRHRQRTLATSLLTFFAGWIDYLEPINSADEYILYMVHDDPKSRIDPLKSSYDISSLHGDAKVIRKAIIQNANTVYIKFILDWFNKSKEGTVKSFLAYILDADIPDRQGIFDCFLKYQYLFTRVSNERKDELFYSEKFSRLPRLNSETFERDRAIIRYQLDKQMKG